jgi:hypothetical protein
MNVPQDIVELLEDYLDGKLDQAGREHLTSWTRESDANGRALAAWFTNEAQLLEAARLADMRVVFEGMTYDAHPTHNQAPALRPQKRAANGSRKVLIAAATILAVLAAAQIWNWRANGRRHDGGLAAKSGSANSGHIANEPQPSPAILSRLADCVWADGAASLRVGQDIVAGATVDIKSGLAQLVFDNGAEIVLKGPCRLQVENSMLCRLFSGNVSAEVPHRAAGFTIRGPASEVIDLGTRFGFSVGTAGKSEVHVFQGEVISRELDEQGEVVGDEIRLKKNQAILFPGEKKQAQRLAANEAKFALEVKPLWLQDKIEPLAVDRKLGLWLRAEHGVQTDRKNRVVAWQDLALKSNRIANDAFQPDAKSRPQYVLDGFGGRPAIRFDGSAAHLTTTPMTTTDNQTIVVVFQHAEYSGGGERIGGQIINYNGPPSRFLPDVNSPGVLQLGEKIDTWNGPLASIAAKAFVGRDANSGNVSAGVVVSESLGYDKSHVAIYVYNHTENFATLYVDGQRVAEASAPTTVAVTSRKVIGKHGIFDQWYFCGDLGELLIYNAALRTPEIKSLSEHLMNRYGISRSGGN